MALVYETLVRTAVRADQVATFLGRKLGPRSQGEVGNHFHTRIAGTRITYHIGLVVVKMYDKFGQVLRLERADAALLQVLLQGEFTISGFRNKDLRWCLPVYDACQISHVLKRLRTHGLIKKMSRTYNYDRTRAGRLVAATVLKLLEFLVIPSLAYPVAA